MKNLAMKSYGKLTTGLVAAWFVFALSASALFWFKNDANRIGIAVAIAAVAPILIFAAWFAASEKFRRFALSLDPQILTLAKPGELSDSPSSSYRLAEFSRPYLRCPRDTAI
jgi:hypothetical protein